VDGETVLNADEVGCALQHLSTGRKGRGGWLAALFALVWLARVRSRTRAGRGVVR